MAVSMVDMRDSVGFLPLISLLAVNGMKLTYAACLHSCPAKRLGSSLPQACILRLPL